MTLLFRPFWKTRFPSAQSSARSKVKCPARRQIPVLELLEDRRMFALAVDYLDPIGWTALQTQLGPAMPTGAGITVSQIEHLEHGAGGYLPDYTVPQLAGKSPTAESGPSITSQHATNVGSVLYGSAGVAPGVTKIDNWEATDWSADFLNDGTTLPPDVETQKIENQSWDGGTAPANSDLETLQRFDYMINRDNVVAAVAVGNEGNNIVPNLLAANYNAITVGLSNGTANHGLTTLDGTGRTKPDIVAPEQTSSLATAEVSGAAALLLDQASHAKWSQAEKTAGQNELTVKATILAGATKQQFPSWSRTPQDPIDAVYGAGQLNVDNNYHVMAAGEQAPGKIDLQGWDLTQSAATTGSNIYTLTVPAGTKIDQMSVALTWNSTVSSGLVGGFGDLKESLATLDMAFNQVNGAKSTTVDSSVSTVDNVQYLYLKNLTAGTYQIVVTGNQAHVPYALAWSSVTNLNAAPTIAVIGNGTQIPQGEANPSTANDTNFGKIAVGTAGTIQTYTIQNTGTATLNLTSSPAVQSSNATEFRIISQPATKTLAPGATTTFEVQFDPTTSGLRTATLTIASNDKLDSPFKFGLDGNGTATAPTQTIIDDSNSGFKTSGAWSTTTGSGFDGNLHFAAAGKGASVATWTFTDLPAGQYQVSTEWVAGANRATNAPYKVFDGSSLESTVLVNQQVAPGGTSSEGAVWQALSTVTISSGTLRVTLSNNANGEVIADAIRLIGPLPADRPNLQLSFTGVAIADNESTPQPANGTNFGNVNVAGGSKTETFTITNTGNVALTLSAGAVKSNSTQFSVTQPALLSIPAGGKTTFTVTFNPSASGTQQAIVSIASNDQLQSPFRFEVEGTGT
jgi:hypothetical protein